MLKILKVFSLIILTLAALSFHTYLTKRYAKNESIPLGYDRVVESLTYFPETATDVLESNFIKGIPDTYCEIDSNIRQFNAVDNEFSTLGGYWDDNDGVWTVKLKNFVTDSILRSWRVSNDLYSHKKSPRLYENAEVANPILLKDNSVIVSQIGSYSLFRLDSLSNVVWKLNDYYLHHAMNLDHDGHLWICARKNMRQLYQIDQSWSAPYLDDLIVKVDINSGEVIYENSIIDILKRNELVSQVFGMNGAMNSIESKFDPIHLNDVEPVLYNGVISKKGDLWLSFRNNSSVVLYRPSNKKVLRYITGPFVHQHDVDIVNDSIISVFNNNYVVTGRDIPRRDTKKDTLYSSQLVHYNWFNNTVEYPLQECMEQNQISTATEGLIEQITEDLWFVEEQNSGLIYCLSKDSAVCRRYYQLRGKAIAEKPHWTRVYKNINND